MMRVVFSLTGSALAWVLLLAGCRSAGDFVREPVSLTAGDSVDVETIAVVRAAAHPLSETAADYGPLFDLIGDAQVVLLGEATHGTHEFYRERARITRRLIEEKGFTAVAIEGDWPDAYRVNRYVRGTSDDASANEALGGFQRFPTWMWRNADMLEFVEWLREYNQSLPATAVQAGFYGLDLYSLFPSIEAVTTYLERSNPEAARRARRRYRCFNRFHDDPIGYGQAVELGSALSCKRQVTEQVQDLQSQRPQAAVGDAEEAFFVALQNARLVQRAEEYYRSMFLRGVSTWNLRDRYMMETLETLIWHLGEGATRAKIVVWAHNSHVGNARATHQGDLGELNLGQLARSRWGRDAVLVGFTTYTGTVTAASEWGASPERKAVRPALPGSYEDVFHQTGIPRFLLTLRTAPVEEKLERLRLERAIGVIYLPQTERASHYFHARLPAQFDAIIHFDETRAVEPLAPILGMSMGEYPHAGSAWLTE